MKPHVSVVIPAFNASRFIGQAIESMLGQTFNDFELIVVDDGSTDETVKIVQTYADPRIRLLQNATNKRLAATLNWGIAEARGNLIARMDADDVAHPSRLSAQVSFMNLRSDIVMAGTGIRRFDDAGRTLEISVPVADPSLLRWRHQFSNQFFHPTVILRRQALLDLGLSFGVVPDWAREHAGQMHVDHLSEDYLLFGLLGLRVPISNMPDVLVDLRVHPQSVSNSGFERQLEMARRVSGLLLSCVVGRPVNREVVDLLYFTRAIDAPEALIQEACAVLEQAAAAHVTRFKLDCASESLIRRDLRLRQAVLRAAHRPFSSRMARLLGGPLIPRDEEERRLVTRAVFSELVIDRLKRLRATGLTALHKDAK